MYKYDFRCHDCGVNTLESNEYYVLKDKIWKATNLPKRSMACISCVEKRINRLLDHNDFQDVPLHNPCDFNLSKKLMERLNLS